MPEDTKKPLEWWEKIQIDLVEAVGFPAEAQRFREHPEEWREQRVVLRAALRGRKKVRNG